jgi:hypothetical protein
MFIVVMFIAWIVGLGSTLALAFGVVKELCDLADERDYLNRGQLGRPCITSDGHRKRWRRRGRRGQAAKECVPRHAHGRQATVARCHASAARDRPSVTNRSDHAHRLFSGRGSP